MRRHEIGTAKGGGRGGSLYLLVGAFLFGAGAFLAGVAALLAAAVREGRGTKDENSATS